MSKGRKVNELEEMTTELPKPKPKCNKKKKMSKNRICKNCRTIKKRFNMCVIRIPEEEREKGTEEIFEMMIENFPNLMTYTKV